MRSLLPALVLALFAGRPALAVDPADLGPVADARYTRGQADPVADEPWWRLLGDDRLAATVEDALGANLDLARTRAQVAQSRAGATQALSPIVPSLTGNASAQIAPTESLGFQFGGLPTQPGQPEPPKTFSQGSATLDAAWQIDVFGRNTATWRAAQRDARAADADLDNAGVATAVQVAEAYLDVVVARERRAVVEEQLQTNRDLLEVLELRYGRGDATSLDVLQQRQQLASTEALLPTVILALETSQQRLAVLLGRSPTEPVPTAEALPDVPDAIAVGTPADLVDHRPDLQAAARRLEAAEDRRWSAYAALAPTLSISAQAGWQFFDRGELLDQTFWNAGARVSVPIFGGGRTVGGIQQARAAHDAQAAAFQGAVLTAVQQVEGALSREAAQRSAVAAQRAQLEAARAAYEAARDQYLEGLTPYLNVQSALGRQQSAELTLLQGRRDLLSARIALHQALGGPWALDLDPSSSPIPEAQR